VVQLEPSHFSVPITVLLDLIVISCTEYLLHVIPQTTGSVFVQLDYTVSIAQCSFVVFTSVNSPEDDEGVSEKQLNITDTMNITHNLLDPVTTAPSSDALVWFILILMGCVVLFKCGILPQRQRVSRQHNAFRELQSTPTHEDTCDEASDDTDQEMCPIVDNEAVIHISTQEITI
jgi:hypothetical protein